MPKYSLNRKFSALVCAIATAIIGIDFSMGSKPANAGIVDLTCTGGYSVTYNPGLTFEEKQTTLKNDATLTCIPLAGNSSIISGRASGTYTINASCDLASQGPSDVTYYWSDGQYSKVHAQVVNEKPVGDSAVIATGLVTEGEFKNDTVTVTIATATPDSAKCASTTGVTSSTGDLTITLVHP